MAEDRGTTIFTSRGAIVSSKPLNEVYDGLYEGSGNLEDLQLLLIILIERIEALESAYKRLKGQD